MALAGTHIRLALDVIDKYNIKDLGRYISGTSYPDSRYITKIARSLTHVDKYLDKNWPQTDFQAGWQVHLVGDRALAKTILEEIPWFNKFDLNKHCVESDAIKILLNINDTPHADMQKYLDFMVYTENPNNEDVAMLKKHYAIFHKMYKGKKQLSVEDGYNVYRLCGLPEEMVKEIKRNAEKFMKDKELMKTIAGLYDKMLLNFDKVLK